MSFGKSHSQNQSQSTSQQTLDPQIKGALLGNYGNVQNMVGNTPSQYGGQLVAGFNPTQVQGQQGLLGLAGSNIGDSALGGAGAAYGSAATYKPGAVNPISLAGTDLNPYMNPYTKNVTDQTLSDLDRSRQIANVGNDASATQAGAFGGDRSAVLDSLTNGEYARTAASTLAGLNQSNFENAQGAARGDIANRLSADQGNQSAGLQGANLNLQAGSGLAALSGQQLAQALQKAGLVNQVGAQQQGQEQAGLDASRNQFQTNLGNKISLQQLINQAIGLAGNPTLGNGQSTGSGSSSSISFTAPPIPV